MAKKKTRNRLKIYDERIEVRMTPDEKETFLNAAFAQKLTLSQWLRRAAWMVVNKHDGKVQS